MTTQPYLFCFGYGYTSDWLAQTCRKLSGFRIGGTTRDTEKRDILRQHGIDAALFDFEQPLIDPLSMLQDVTHILISTPPIDAGDPTFLIHGEDLLRLKKLQWVGYLSTTGVYGDREGGWVSEESEIRPTTKRGSRRARAEEQWLSLYQEFGLPVHIFRLAGIYGPERSALDSVRAGVARRIDKPGQAFSRVHVEDIVQVLQASMANPSPGQAYNVCDDSASPSHEVIFYACNLLGLAPPPLIPFHEADMAPIARSFYSDNKRVRNAKIKEHLGIQLLHPDYKSGLQACLAYEREQSSSNNFHNKKESVLSQD